MMVPAAFGAIQAAIEALDARLNPEVMATLERDDMNAAWLAASELCDAADALYAKLRAAYATQIADATRQSVETESAGNGRADG